MKAHPGHMRLIGLAALIGVLLTAAGCETTNHARSSRDGYPSEELPILWEKSGAYSRLTRPVRVLVRDRSTLARIPIAEVEVDFDTQMVLIAGLGRTATSEMGIRIARVWREGSRIRVQERRIHPGFDEGSAGLDPASPWAIAVIPRSGLNVEGYTTYVPGGVLSDHHGAR